jgi:hypothetical protein
MKIILLLICIIVTFFAHAQNVGIGTSNPLARLHVSDSAVLFSGTNNLPATPGPPPIEGIGKRMMWYPAKAAFRTGIVNGTYWDKDSIGTFSFAAGFNVLAKGSASISMGYNSIASGDFSLAMGLDVTSSNAYTTTFGVGTKATAAYATAFGANTIASGINATSLGYYTSATAPYSSSLGYRTQANGEYATSTGLYTVAGGAASSALGVSSVAKGFSSTVVGHHNDSILSSNETYITAGTPLFIIGNGANNTARSNAMTVLNNGNTGIGTSAPLARLHVTDSAVLFSASGNIPVTAGLPPIQGTGRRMMWYPEKAAFRAGYIDGLQWDKDSIGSYSFASGYNAKAKGFKATAIGSEASAGGNYSTAIGGAANASGTYSTALGLDLTASGIRSLALGYQTTASGFISTSMGNQTIASGDYSVTMGDNTYAKSAYENVIGRWNTDYTPVNSVAWDATDRLFTIGNGTGFFSRSDAITVLKNGNVGIGTSTPGFPLNFASSFGDKISFYGNSGTHYGIGMQNNLMQIHSDASASDIAFGYGISASFSEKMRIKGNGNVGIGTATPLSKLHIFSGASGNITPFSPVVIEGNNNTYINLLTPNNNESGLLFGKADNAASGGILYNSTGALNGLQFRTNGNITRMILTNNGNVGIGLTTPSAQLSISQNGTELAGSSASNSLRTLAGTLGSTAGNELNLASIGFASSNNSSLGIRAYRTTAGSDWTTTSLLLSHDVDNSPKINGGYIALAANGNIGIGSVTPAAKLHVSAGEGSVALFGPNSYGAQLYVGASATNFSAAALTAQVLASDGNMHLDPAPNHNLYLGYYQARDIYLNPNGGKVGIGTTAPAATFEVNGYTKLGNNAPSIKVKKLTGITTPTEGVSQNIAHGLNASKIISVTVIVQSGSTWYGPNIQGQGYNFYWTYNGSNVTVYNVFGDSANILSKPFTVMVTYEE